MAERIRIAKGVHIYRRPDSPTWYVDIVREGRRTRCSARTQDAEEAASYARSLAADASQVARLPWSLEDAYLLWMRELERSETDVSALRVLRERLPNVPAASLTETDVADALAGMSAGSYNRLTNVLRAALKLSASRGRIPAAPTIKRKPEPAGRVRFLSPEEWERLRAALPAHLLPAVEFSLATGLRRANVLGLRWDQVDMRRKMLHLPASAMKAGKPHSIPLGTEALKVLKAQAGKHAMWAFPYRGKRIVSPKRAFSDALKAAEISDFRWHDLRHTWASWMAMSGAPLHAIQQAGAWASPDMVARYSHLSPSAIGQYQDAAIRNLRKTKKPAAKKKAA